MVLKILVILALAVVAQTREPRHKGRSHKMAKSSWKDHKMETAALEEKSAADTDFDDSEGHDPQQTPPHSEASSFVQTDEESKGLTDRIRQLEEQLQHQSSLIGNLRIREGMKEMADMFHKLGGDAAEMNPIELGEWASGFGEADTDDHHHGSGAPTHGSDNIVTYDEFRHYWEDSKAHEDILFQTFSNEHDLATGKITLAEWLEEFGDADDVDYFWSDGAAAIDYTEFKDWYEKSTDPTKAD